MFASDLPLSGPSARQRGLSIIELMVGIVVAMLVGLAATTSAIMFSASQRQGMGTGSAAVNSATTLSAIKADASLAGLGFFNESNPMCATLNLSVGALLVSNGSAFSPLSVTRDGAHDILNVIYASTIESGTNVLLASASDGTVAELRSLLPVSAGQTVLLAPENSGGLCTVRSVTAVTAATATTFQTLNFDAVGTDSRHNQVGFATTGSYPTRARVGLLGTLRWNRYRVVDGNLMLERPLDGTSAVLARNVMAFRVQYGVSATTTSSTLDDWVDATGTFATLTAANIDRVRAVRIALLVRSPQREKVNASGDCTATQSAPQVFGTVPDPGFTGTDWMCFRYRNSAAVVPVRNFVF